MTYPEQNRENLPEDSQPTIIHIEWRTLVRELIESLGLAVLLFFVLQSTIQNTRVEGSSMEPTLHNNQYILVDKLSYRLGLPLRGDVIVFHAPAEPGKDLIKRIIGLPGEQIEIQQGKIYINGQLLDPRYQLNTYTYSMPPQVIGPDQYFVLGDNRGNSNDSHIWGMLPRENIVGKAWITLWPPQQWGVLQSAITHAANP
ncbi:MAG: signal peptidase I [Chloroflexi bacterium]|nr:signal peptidase I [Chloroflexota bacterium]